MNRAFKLSIITATLFISLSAVALAPLFTLMSILFSIDASTDTLPVIFISVVSVFAKAKRKSASFVMLVLSANATCVKSETSIAKDKRKQSKIYGVFKRI